MNWVNLETPAFWRKEAEKQLEKVKSKIKGKKIKLIKISDKPLTYKEVYY